ncbi:GNAT family N-acetyltransferase [Streptomyces sp. LE64]|uniref:GNAT family N-acetyltransferase n=1 Tax=Streptomyces sp. LE64 TaxID=3448653 RepID=UPI0040415FBB
MTTTLRPVGPLQQQADGGRSRTFRICVNSRPVGEIHLATHEGFGPRVAQVRALHVDEPERGRGRGTVAALAAEEVARGWDCQQLQASVPADAAVALRLAHALGYTERSRHLTKRLDLVPAPPPGSTARPMEPAEYGPWREAAGAAYLAEWTERGVPEPQARAKVAHDWARLLPEGPATPGAAFGVLEHDGATVGTIWVTTSAPSDDGAFVLDVEVAPERRGEGHGRTLMRHAERIALDAGHTRLGLNVFAGNTPALRLYESLGYRPVAHHLYKPLV